MLFWRYTGVIHKLSTFVDNLWITMQTGCGKRDEICLKRRR